MLQHDLHWNEADYGWINFAFQSAYALMYTLAGRLVDVVGSRTGFIIGVAVWSIAAMAHAAARGTLGFGVARFCLGAGESINFPAALKAVAEWFPQKERALATGIFNSGTNMGVILGVGIVWIATQLEWQAAFVITGLLGFVWLVLWIRYYRPIDANPSVSAAELEYILEGRGDAVKQTPMRWTTLLRYRQAWPFLLGKFLTDPVWWFYLFWLPGYLHKARGLSVVNSAAWLAIPYLAADFGSVGGGWLSGYLMRRGWSVGRARYAAMGLCAICMPGAIVAVTTGQWVIAISLISLATAAHQGWSANLFTTATDLFPSSVAGSVVGLGGTTGAIGGMLMTLLVGGTLQWTNSYVPIFIWAGLMHPLSWILYVLILGPEMRPAEIRTDIDSTLSRPLIVTGALTFLAGGAGTALTILHWGYLVELAGASAAAGGVTTAIGIALIGAALFVAGLPRKPGEQSLTSTRVHPASK